MTLEIGREGSLQYPLKMRRETVWFILFVMKYVTMRSNRLLGEKAISALESRSSVVGKSSSSAMAKATAVFFFGL